GAEGEEGAVREVQHVHQPVDEAQPAGDQEVEGAQAHTDDKGQDERAHAWASALTPRSRRVRFSSSRIVLASPVCTTRPPAITIAPWASVRTTSRFCSTRRIGTVLDASCSAWATAVTILGARPLV